MHLMLTASKIYGVATFYDHFRFSPKGEYHITVCKGTSCHLNEGDNLAEEIEKKLKIRAGQVSKDGMFSLESTSCMGACGTGPVISVNGVYHTKMSPSAVNALIDNLKNL